MSYLEFKNYDTFSCDIESLTNMICMRETQRIMGENKYYEKGDPTEATWEMKDGQYFSVEDGIATFTPYSGKISLGFQ